MYFNFIDLFAGIGGFHCAASSLGGKCVFASEIDTDAVKAYEYNYGLKPHGDICAINANEIPNFDILFAGFPCQPFSIAGKGQGFKDTRGVLFFEIIRILKAKRPALFMLENGKRLAGHDSGNTLATILKELSQLGYYVKYKILNALDYGLPQKRERIIICGFLDYESYLLFEFPKPFGHISLESILEKNVDLKHYASQTIQQKRKAAHKSAHKLAIWHENKAGNISSYPYSCALRAGASYNYLLVNGERRLTPRECLRLQGFPDSFKIVVNDSATRKQAGNAVPVTMIKAVLERVLYAYTKAEKSNKKAI